MKLLIFHVVKIQASYKLGTTNVIYTPTIHSNTINKICGLCVGFVEFFFLQSTLRRTAEKLL